MAIEPAAALTAEQKRTLYENGLVHLKG
eukprot:COSAG06_NODE_45570_length_353_cov_5.724409_1_plen_27_part_01